MCIILTEIEAGIIYPIMVRELITRVGFKWAVLVLTLTVASTLLFAIILVRPKYSDDTDISLPNDTFKDPRYIMVVMGIDYYVSSRLHLANVTRRFHLYRCGYLCSLFLRTRLFDRHGNQRGEILLHTQHHECFKPSRPPLAQLSCRSVTPCTKRTHENLSRTDGVQIRRYQCDDSLQPCCHSTVLLLGFGQDSTDPDCCGECLHFRRWGNDLCYPTHYNRVQ